MTNTQQQQQHHRGTWKNKADFILALISYGVGLGNVWRFPYLAYSSGGGAFLIPFLVSSVAVGIPYALLEVSLGQWMKEGGIGAWNLTPIFKGIGFANLLIVFLGNVYYEVILAWTLRYLFDSFTTELPWKSCKNKWNSKCCSETLLYGGNNLTTTSTNLNSSTSVSSFALLLNSTSELQNNDYYVNNSLNSIMNLNNLSNKNLQITNNNNCSKIFDPITEYWELNILGISSGINEIGSIKWDLFVALLVAWLVVYFSIFRGMKNSSYVVYLTAVMPYVFLFIILLRSLFLPGALDGIIYYLKPDWQKLTEFQVWSDAGTQVFYSYGIGISALIALGSYNEFHHNSYRDVVLFTITNSFTSILAGFVIFSTLGYMAHIQGVDISSVAEEGPGLAFIVYPQALSLMPFSPIWSIMFFIMLFLLGLGTQIVAAEAITTAIIDEYMPLIKSYYDFKYTKEFFSAINVLISFICGLPMITNGGMYVFQIFDYYAASRTLLFVGLFECVAIAYSYGLFRYCKNMEVMWRFRLGPFLKIMWGFLTPLFTLVLIVFTVMTYEDLTYNRTYKYPSWALKFGWILSISSFICIPIYAIYKWILTGGSFTEKFSKLRVSHLKSHQLDIFHHHHHHHNKNKQTNDLSNECESNNANRISNHQLSQKNDITQQTLCEEATNLINENELNSRYANVTNSGNSISDEDNQSEFANSRTIIKP